MISVLSVSAELFDRVDDPAHLVIGMGGVAGEHLHHPRVDRFWSAFSESHAGSPSGRGVSFVSCGTTPSFFCRAKVSSRYLSQP